MRTHTQTSPHTLTIECYCQNKNKHEHGLNIGYGAVWGTLMRTEIQTRHAHIHKVTGCETVLHNTHRHDMRAQRIRIEKFDAHKHTNTWKWKLKRDKHKQTEYHWKSRPFELISNVVESNCLWAQIGNTFLPFGKELSSLSKIVLKIKMKRKTTFFWNPNNLFHHPSFCSSTRIYVCVLCLSHLYVLHLSFVVYVIFVYIKWHTNVCVCCSLRRSYVRSCIRTCVRVCVCM